MGRRGGGGNKGQKDKQVDKEEVRRVEGIKGGSQRKECTGKKGERAKEEGKRGGRGGEQTAPGSHNANTLQSSSGKGGIS